jgi:hypothetical protein
MAAVGDRAPAVVARRASAAAQDGFLRGIFVGAAVALAGVVVGAVVNRFASRR